MGFHVNILGNDMESQFAYASLFVALAVLCFVPT